MEFNSLDEHSQEIWSFEARKLLERQPFIKSQIMDAMRRDNSISYDGLSNHINNWCSPSTIRRWVISREGY